MLGILYKSIIVKFFSKNIISEITVNNSIVEDTKNVKSSKSDSKKLLELKKLIAKFEHFLPTNSGHLNATKPNHLDELKHLRDLVSKIKVNLGPNFKIILTLNHKNFVLHDSLTYCDMILNYLQKWDENKILSRKENILLNKVLVNFSNDMHNVLTHINY
jgi:hypothetical protein